MTNCVFFTALQGTCSRGRQGFPGLRTQARVLASLACYVSLLMGL